MFIKLTTQITLMDETDTKILKRLLADARSSYRKIAFEIGVSPPTVA